MKKIITSVKLAPGNRGYFDPLTGMNLSISNNIGYVREDDNIDNIRKAIKEGKILIVGGQLPPAITIEPVKEQSKPEIPKVKEVKIKKPVKEKKTNNTKKKEKEKEITEITIPVGIAKTIKEEIKQDEPKEEVIKDTVKDGE
ncbi:MAG: hypothetical protein ACI3T9_02970 [Romboutsia timonensis]